MFRLPSWSQSVRPLIYENLFETAILPAGTTIHTVGSFTAPPGIKPCNHFGSSQAFGFGKTDCLTNCWDTATATLRIELSQPTPIAFITFFEAELEGNWGSTGLVTVDGHLVNDGQFERLPWNDLTADDSFRTRELTVNLIGQVIEFRVVDITATSEMFIDNLQIFTYRPIQTTNLFESFELDPPQNILTVRTNLSFPLPPGIRAPVALQGNHGFGFGKSACHVNCWDDNTTSLEFELPQPQVITFISFAEVESDSNWGGHGVVHVDGREVAGTQFGRLPYNDWKIDVSPRYHFFPIHQIGKKISIHVSDITDVNEMVVDEITIGLNPLAEGVPLLREDFEDGLPAPEMVTSSQGQFITAPGIRETSLLGGGRAYGFGRSECGLGCFRDYQSSIRLVFPYGVELAALRFKAREVNGNWGSQGELLVNAQVWPSMDFARWPSNDQQADDGFRAYECNLGVKVWEIEWRVWDIADVSEVLIDDIEVIPQQPGGVAAAVPVPETISLLQNFPNPFNSATAICFTLARPAPVTLTLFNEQGQIIEKKNLGHRLAGAHRVDWHAGHLPSGFYFCRLESPSEVRFRRLSLIR